MCGIVGQLNFNRPPNCEAVEQASKRIHHRGPDDAGMYHDEHICLAFRRLSIIDVQNGAQPMCNEDKSIWVVYNGEIYNFENLRKQLKSSGHTFKTRCDTEVILHQYEEKGDACAKTFDGMFAFALWDKNKRRLFLARDRVGIKPLYYTQTKDSFAFASELKALLALPGVAPTIDHAALSNYLTYRYVPGPRTIFENIHKLQPGHTLTVENGTVGNPKPYWDMSFHPEQQHASDDELIHQFDTHLRNAVESHLISDVPLGVLLSGGLDSTAMVAYMRDLGINDLKTFSVAFDTGGIYDERPFAREAAEAFQTDHHEVVIGAKDFEQTLDAFVWHADEPLADLASIPLFAVSQLARKHVTVVLSGEGSDELLGGYPGIERIIQRGEWLKHLQIIPQTFRGLGAKMLSPITSSEKQKWLQAFAGPMHTFAQTLQLSMTGVFSSQEKQGLLNDFAPKDIHADQAILNDIYKKQNIDAPLNQTLYMYIKGWLPDNLLAKADRMTMANALELRVPFLDNNVVEFTASLPNHLKVYHDKNKGSWTQKYILRKALEARIPQSILHRPKQGFPVPAYGWLANELKDFAYDTLTDQKNPALDFFSSSNVTQYLTQSQNGDRAAQRKIWVLLMFALWYKRYLK